MERILLLGGQFGRFHARVCAIPLLVSFLSAFSIMAPVYVLFDPPHRCRLPEESGWHWNDSMVVQGDEHNASVLQFIPEGSDNSSRLSRCHVRLNGSELACSDWVFSTDEFDSTLVTELGLVCKNSHWSTFISTCSFAGILVGIVLAGYLADWLGRRVSLIGTLWVLTIAQLASMFAVSVAFTAVSRFLSGLGALSSYSVAYVMIFEFVGPKARHHIAAVFGYSWSVGTAAVALMAYRARSWRNYAVASLIPTAVLLLLVHFPCLAPETPRWLLSRGREKAAARLIRQMLMENGKSAEEADQAVKELQSLRKEAGDPELCKDGPSVRKSLVLLMRSPRLLLRYGIICCNWFLVIAVYFGISMGAKNLPGSIFVTSCLIGAIDFPSYLIMHLAANRLGRKTTYIASLGGSGLALIGLAAVSHLGKEHSWLIITLSLIGKMLNSTAYAVLCFWTGELYPTNIRSAGMATSSMFGRFGALFAPLLGNIRDFIPGDFGPVVSYVIFAASSFTAGGIALALPETRGLAIADTVEDLLRGGSVKHNGTTEVDIDLVLLSPQVEET